jgi:putative oxidoreductase
MLVALFLFHKEDPFLVKEKAALYLAAFTALLLAGGGQLSLDRVLWSWTRKPKKS